MYLAIITGNRYSVKISRILLGFSKTQAYQFVFQSPLTFILRLLCQFPLLPVIFNHARNTSNYPCNYIFCCFMLTPKICFSSHQWSGSVVDKWRTESLLKSPASACNPCNQLIFVESQFSVEFQIQTILILVFGTIPSALVIIGII